MAIRYTQQKQQMRSMLENHVQTLTVAQASAFFEQVLAISTEDALAVGLAALEKEDAEVADFADRIACLLWADGNYSMLPILIEKMDAHEQTKNIYFGYIKTLVLGCSQTRKPLLESELTCEAEKLIKIYRT